MDKRKIYSVITGKGEDVKGYCTDIEGYDKIVETEKNGVIWFELYRGGKLHGKIKESCVEKVFYDTD